jgi:hypothetical protein
MNQFKNLCISLTAIIVLLTLPSQALARGGSYNCKGDKAVDVPMQMNAVVESAGRVHLYASGGSDKSGLLQPWTWNLYDGSGRKVDYFPKADLGFASPNMLKDTSLEGLIPGLSYTLELISRDFCGNQASQKKTVAMPYTGPEVISPVLSPTDLVQVGFGTTSFKYLHFSVTDNTGVQDVATYINGIKVSESKYYDGVSFRWWCDNYPDDGVQTTLEGPNYYIYYPDSFRGQPGSVDVVITDVYGNTTMTSAVLWL